MTRNPNVPPGLFPRVPDVDTSKMLKSNCEFCGRRYWIDSVDFGVLHELPFCPEFGAMDPLTFVSQNNRIKERKAVRA